VETLHTGQFDLIKFGHLGPYDNNAYVIADRATGEGLIVDMPAESQSVLQAVRDLRVKAIALTHTHPDHWADYDLVTQATRAPVHCHPAERIMPADKIDRPLADGDEIAIGGLAVTAIHTPGHTPGSTCFLVGSFILTGDALFPGGPGRTISPPDLQEAIRSITGRLYRLPDQSAVLPGHGGDTHIADSRLEYAAFAAREHPLDLCGDVTWAS